MLSKYLAAYQVFWIEFRKSLLFLLKFVVQFQKKQIKPMYYECFFKSWTIIFCNLPVVTVHTCTQLEERLADRHTARTTKKVDDDEFNKLANQYVDSADKKEEPWVDTTEFNLAIGAAVTLPG